MENSSLPDDVTCNSTMTVVPPGDNRLVSNLFFVSVLAMKIIYIMIGAVGLLDNLFVIIVFIFFIKIADKVGLLMALLALSQLSRVHHLIIFIHTRQCRTEQRQTQRIIQSINLSYVSIESVPNTSFKMTIRSSV